MTENYYHTKASVAEYIKLAEGVNGLELIEKLKTFLPEHSLLLELGSGPGSDWKILKEYFNVVGSDNSLEFLSHLKSKHSKGTFLELDAVTLKTETRFEGIYSNKVLHHLTDKELIDSIQRQNMVLKSEGIVCHSFWKGEGHEVFKGMLVNYHTEAELRGLFEKQFEILTLEAYAEFEAGDSILIIGKKKIND
jgi:trans-aconitate methyltransferase